jgi:hypothetical protein
MMNKKELEALGINTRGKVIRELHASCLERNIPITRGMGGQKNAYCK